MRDERIARLEQRLADAKAAQRRIIDQAEEARGRDSSLTTTEDAEFRALTDDIREIQERLDELQGEQVRNDRITAGAAAVRRAQFRVTEPRTYTPESRSSYFRDLMRVKLGMDDAGDSIDRLQRHAQDVATGAEYRDLSRTDGSGGYLTPPAYLVNRYADLARAGRVTANLVNSQPLPPGTDNINIPLIATGTATAAQDGDNAAVQETDLTDSTVSAPVKTIAGQQDVAIQLLDQSPIAFDQLIFEDLLADYATQVDKQLISGTNANGQVKGILNATGKIGVSYTDTTPSVAELYGVVADTIQQMHTGRLMPPTCIVMHPRRWGWIRAARDSEGRPLVVGSGPGVNALATANGVVSEGLVGEMHGLPVYADANIPINLGSGTNEDAVLVLRASDILLWESPVKTRVLPDVGSGTLTVRLQCYGYIAATAEYRPKATGVISSTGLVTPVFS